MYSLNYLRNWRMLPPGGAPISLGAIFHGLAALSFGQGALVALRESLRQRFGVEHVFLVSSGRAALALALTALMNERASEPQRREVLIPAYVSYSVPAALVNAGCKVALYDLDPSTLAPDMDDLSRRLSDQTLAVVACHQFGLPFALQSLAELCRNHGVPLVDDAAQAMGARIGGQDAGCMGDLGLFSLSRSKPTTAVEGGILLLRDATRAQRLQELLAPLAARRPDRLLPVKALALWLLRNPTCYRLPTLLPWLKLGASIFEPDFPRASFSPFQAGLAAYSLERLEDINCQRRAKAALYREELATLPQLRLINGAPESEPITIRFPVLPARQAVSGETRAWGRHLADQDEAKRLGISRGFPLALNAVPGLRPHLTRPADSYPGAEQLARDLITLPTHDQTSLRDCRRAAAFIRDQVMPFSTLPDPQHPET